jgi:kynurenine formamidase
LIADLSHPIGEFAYPGLPPPELRTVATREESAARLGPGISFEIEALTLVGNTGTYIDSPFHYHADLADVAGLPLEQIVDVPVVMVRAEGVPSIGRERLGNLDRLSGRAVLIHTGWSRHWGTPEYSEPPCPHLAADAVAALIEARVAVVGIDSLNIDDPGDPERPAHQGLLGAGIPIIEHLTNLASVPGGARLTALPAPVRGMASFPVRAVAVWQG